MTRGSVIGASSNAHLSLHRRAESKMSATVAGGPGLGVSARSNCCSWQRFMSQWYCGVSALFCLPFRLGPAVLWRRGVLHMFRRLASAPSSCRSAVVLSGGSAGILGVRGSVSRCPDGLCQLAPLYVCPGWRSNDSWRRGVFHGVAEASWARPVLPVSHLGVARSFCRAPFFVFARVPVSQWCLLGCSGRRCSGCCAAPRVPLLPLPEAQPVIFR